jgi:uncharacterized protein GlcG (DUF336 family)
MITLDLARRVIAAAEKKAADIKQPMNIAVVDGGGNLVAFARMDGAWLGSIQIAQKKAWTSRAFDIETKTLSKFAQPGADFYGIHVTNGGVTIFAGGVPLMQGKEVVGAIGVSGGSGKQDQEVAEAGAAVVKK